VTNRHATVMISFVLKINKGSALLMVSKQLALGLLGKEEV